MAWGSSNNISGGQWVSWTPQFRTGDGIFDATDMFWYNCRWTVLEGTVYAQVNFTLGGTSNRGNGTDPWQLIIPDGMPRYADADTGGRTVGRGQIYDTSDPPNSAILDLRAVNTYSQFFSMHLIRYTLAGGGNWNNGNYNHFDFKRDELTTFCGGNRTIYCSFYLRYIGASTY